MKFLAPVIFHVRHDSIVSVLFHQQNGSAFFFCGYEICSTFLLISFYCALPPFEISHAFDELQTRSSCCYYPPKQSSYQPSIHLVHSNTANIFNGLQSVMKRMATQMQFPTKHMIPEHATLRTPFISTATAIRTK